MADKERLAKMKSQLGVLGFADRLTYGPTLLVSEEWGQCVEEFILSGVLEIRPDAGSDIESNYPNTVHVIYDARADRETLAQWAAFIGYQLGFGHVHVQGPNGFVLTAITAFLIRSGMSAVEAMERVMDVVPVDYLTAGEKEWREAAVALEDFENTMFTSPSVRKVG